jgi:hypothetical protein
MNDLLDFVLDAHGGVKRWSGVSTLTAKLATTPFLLTFPGVQAREISPWQEDGQTCRRLHVTFPASITTHSAEQVFYFGADGLLRRLDYTTEVNAGDPVAHYTEDYKTFDGLAFPTRRRVYRRNPGRTPDRSQPAS